MYICRILCRRGFLNYACTSTVYRGRSTKNRQKKVNAVDKHYLSLSSVCTPSMVEAAVKTSKIFTTHPPRVQQHPSLRHLQCLPGRHWPSRRELRPLSPRGKGVGCLRSSSGGVAGAAVLSSRHGDPHRRHLLRRNHGVVVRSGRTRRKGTVRPRLVRVS